VLGGAPDPVAVTAKLLEDFGPGPVVVGPAVPSLDEATESARAAIAGYRAAPTWPDAPRPVPAADLLPERALAGDADARRLLRTDVYGALQRNVELLDTLDAFFATGGVLESTARTLYVHPNTVRYRLRRITDLTGCPATRSRCGSRWWSAASTRRRRAPRCRPRNHPTRQMSHDRGRAETPYRTLVL